jgi:hypothetical protein
MSSSVDCADATDETRIEHSVTHSNALHRNQHRRRKVLRHAFKLDVLDSWRQSVTEAARVGRFPTARVHARATHSATREKPRGECSPPRAIARIEAAIQYTVSVLSIAFLFIVLIGLAGWIPLYLCWWGRLTPQPPYCAACGHASGDTPEMLAARCAECGCDLNEPNALVYFRRERTPLMRAGIIAGAIVVTLCLLLPVASISVFLFAVGRQGVMLRTPNNNVVAPAVDSTPSEETPSDALEPSDDAATEQTPSESSAQEDVR